VVLRCFSKHENFLKLPSETFHLWTLCRLELAKEVDEEGNIAGLVDDNEEDVEEDEGDDDEDDSVDSSEDEGSGDVSKERKREAFFWNCCVQLILLISKLLFISCTSRFLFLS